MSPDKRQAGDSLLAGVVCQSIQPKETFLQVAIRIFGGRSSDKIEYLEGVSLRHRLHHIVELGVAGCNPLQT